MQIEISDEGIGISREDQEKLFRIDRSFSNPGTNREKGSGLGLIICKEFVQQNQGDLWVESEQENVISENSGGSSFKFTLKPA